jgi:hypothetical protein
LFECGELSFVGAESMEFDERFVEFDVVVSSGAVGFAVAAFAAEFVAIDSKANNVAAEENGIS